MTPPNHGRLWTPQQRLRMLKLWMAGRSVHQIARHMGRQTDSILAQFEKLGLNGPTEAFGYGTPYPPDSERVKRIHDRLSEVTGGEHHRGPDDPGGGPADYALPEADDSSQVSLCHTVTLKLDNTFPVPPTPEETTMFKFETKHYINGQDVSEMDNATLVKAILQEQAAIAELEKLNPRPKRITKALEERKAKLAEAIEFLDKLDEGDA